RSKLIERARVMVSRDHEFLKRLLFARRHRSADSKIGNWAGKHIRSSPPCLVKYRASFNHPRFIYIPVEDFVLYAPVGHGVVANGALREEQARLYWLARI